MSADRPARLDWPLMRNNITRQDLDEVIAFLRRDDPILTQSREVEAFEREWSDWLGVRHSVFVSSGSSANLLTMAVLRATRGAGEVVVPTLTWVSDVASVLHAGLRPVFVDVDPRTLGMDVDAILAALSERTVAVFLTHVLGFNALDERLLDALARRGIALVEDVCESHGATFAGRKLGTFSLMANFSFYYAHHLSTIEGGMICTDDPALDELLRVHRAHGLVREARGEAFRAAYRSRFPDLHPEFIFAYPAYNVRSTEINAVIGRSQLRRLDAANARRRANLELFLASLDPARYFTEFATAGSCNYAFALVLRHPDAVLRDAVVRTLDGMGVEYRRGLSGGGNQLRQPYLRERGNAPDPTRFPCVEHLHFHGFYIGNYPDLEADKIRALCRALNGLPAVY